METRRFPSDSGTSERRDRVHFHQLAVVQFRHRNDILVCGNLKDAVGRGVDDQRARSHVLGSKFLDDLDLLETVLKHFVDTVAHGFG